MQTEDITEISIKDDTTYQPTKPERKKIAPVIERLDDRLGKLFGQLESGQQVEKPEVVETTSIPPIIGRISDRLQDLLEKKIEIDFSKLSGVEQEPEPVIETSDQALDQAPDQVPDQAPESSEISEVVEPETYDPNNLESLVNKIQSSTDYHCIYALEEEFNKCGLTIQPTSRNRMALCRMVDGRPISEKVVEDYIFIGSVDDLSKDLTDRIVDKVCQFVRTNAGAPGEIQNVARQWRNGIRMYEDTLMIANEDVIHIGEMIRE